MPKPTRKWLTLAAILALALGAGVWGLRRWRHEALFVATEDAFIKGRVVAVASRVPGAILTLDVGENEPVKAGQRLAALDPRDLDALAAKARGSLAETRAAQALNRSQIAQAQAQVRAVDSQRALAELEAQRLEVLAERQAIPRQKLDHARSALQVATAQLDAARRQVAALEDALQVSTAKVAQSEAALEQALLQRSYCAVLAPCDGVVSRKLAEQGMVVAAGQPLLAVVPLDAGELWVEANFKETQLQRLRPGQHVTLRADVDDLDFAGTVESLAAGTGSAFSLLPAENATGNWVKVVQRVPVRIRLAPGADPGHKLRLGLSVTAVVDTRTGP